MKNDLAVWKHAKGMLRRGNDKKWREFNEDYVEVSTFVEEARDATNVVLFNPQRSVRLLLRNDLCGIRSGDEPSFQQLYSGGFVGMADCS